MNLPDGLLPVLLRNNFLETVYGELEYRTSGHFSAYMKKKYADVLLSIPLENIPALFCMGEESWGERFPILTENELINTEWLKTAARAFLMCRLEIGI